MYVRVTCVRVHVRGRESRVRAGVRGSVIISSRSFEHWLRLTAFACVCVRVRARERVFAYEPDEQNAISIFTSGLGSAGIGLLDSGILLVEEIGIHLAYIYTITQHVSVHSYLRSLKH